MFGQCTDRAIKLYTLLDYDGCMSTYLFMTKGKQADVKHVHYMLLTKNNAVVADCGYQDFSMLYDGAREIFTLLS